MAALTIHGNHFLQGGDIRDFWPASSAFFHCKTVTFITFSGPRHDPIQTDYAQDPLAWLEALKQDGVTGLRLHESPGGGELSDRLSVAFAGGGRRYWMEAAKPQSCDIWESRWHIGDRNDPEQKIWAVVYGRTAAGQPPIEVTASVIESLHDELRQNLSDLAGFADRQALGDFADRFRAGLKALDSANPLADVFHSDLAPPDAVPLVAQQLLAAAQAAWVFGGMGSWNDISFEGQDQPLYEQLSDRLFDLLNQAVVEATNTSFTGQTPPETKKPFWKLW